MTDLLIPALLGHDPAALTGAALDGAVFTTSVDGHTAQVLARGVPAYARRDSKHPETVCRRISRRPCPVMRSLLRERRNDP
jgi:hypothetical protein